MRNRKCLDIALALGAGLLIVPLVMTATGQPADGGREFEPLSINKDPAPGPAPAGMVWIPGGWFWMGADDKAHPDAGPIHKVYVDGFWMDRHEVTNTRWAEFVKDTGYQTVAEKKPDISQLPADAKPEIIEALKKQPPFSIVFVPPDMPVDLKNHLQWWKMVEGADWQHPEGPKSDIKMRANHPVVHICYLDAVEYCKWRGKKDKVICRLPTEAEWEFAARGGKHQNKFPWGNDLKPAGKWHANIWQGKFPNQNTKEDGFGSAAPVASFPANAFGLHDMAGNVWEWCEDWYDAEFYKKSPQKNPTGPAKQVGQGEPRRVQRGGSFLCDASYCERYSTYARGKGEINSAADHTGFRCAIIPQELNPNKKQ